MKNLDNLLEGFICYMIISKQTKIEESINITQQIKTLKEKYENQNRKILL